MKHIFLDENIEYYGITSIENAEIINPRLLPEWAKNVIVYLIPYRVRRENAKYMAQFATIKDYHGFSDLLLGRLIPKLKERYPQNNFCGFADHSPINERKLAEICGLGEVGKNGLLLNEKYGSYVFIGEIITDANIPVIISEKKSLCSNCGKCVSACPKNDVCLSELSQKKRKDDNVLNILRETKTVWGCDICAEVCPCNKNAELTPISYFYDDVITHPEKILEMDDDTFKNYAFAYRGRKVIEENIKTVFKL